ncbi:hypothetical protein SAY87_012066 [Trapa incisa]|uniref:Uncharacterized protein n=1 Tax=Trapa incisa TaxID=236973 RepID=A0AAN7GXD3_9MYRT|nr:hypothetical protein SAY87_012066 [Trapa incisa]
MAGDSAVEISPENRKFEVQCGVDTTPCHDLSHCVSDDCNGVKSLAIFEGTENGNEDADKTYVFVNGSDAISENVDIGENCINLAPGEEYAENTELKLNGEFKVGETNINGHFYFEDVVVVCDGAAEVGNGSGMDGESGDHIMEKADMLVTEDYKVESDKLDPLEEMYTSESEALRVPNLEDKFKVDSSSEVVQRVPEPQEQGTNDKGSIDCKQPPEKTEELPEQVDFNSEMLNSDVQAVNDEKAACFRGPEESTAKLSEIMECSSEHLEFHRNADSLCDIKESSNITKQLHVEPASEVVEEVSNPSSVSEVDSDHPYDCKKSSEQAEDQYEQMEYPSDAAEKNHGSQSIGNGASDVVGKWAESSDDIKVISAEVSEQVAENNKSEVVSKKTNSEFAMGDGAEGKMSEEKKLHPIEVEKVEKSSQLSLSAVLLENQGSMKTHANDVTNDMVQGKELVEMASETTVDQLGSMDGGQNQITKPSSCPEPYDIVTTTSGSHIDMDHMLEIKPHPVYMAKEIDDSIDSSLDMKEQDTASESTENLASLADYTNAPVESVESPQTAEETLVTLESDVAERHLVVADGVSSLDLIDREPAAELLVVGDANIPALEDAFSNEDMIGSAVAEMGGEAQDDPAAIDDTITRIYITDSAETKICFGSINHEELSFISINGGSFESKSSFDAVVNQASPDLKSSENDGNDESTAQGAGPVDAAPQSDEVSHVEGSTAMLAEAQILVPQMEERFFNYLVRFPRYGEDLKEQINNAQIQVDGKTQCRDAIQAEIHIIKATRRDYLVELEDANAEERSARESLKSKWQEIDTVQSAVNKVKDAMSIDDIDQRIHNMEQKIEHETIPLKEEKQFLREIKQLKELREQLSSNVGKQDELKEALEQKEQTEELLKVTRKDVDLLRGSVSRAEVVTKAVKKKLYDCNDKLRELQEQFKAADSVRQEAYQELKSLRAQLREKNRYFYKYKNDATILNEMGSKGDWEGVSRFCLKQMEEFMELWSNDVEFRNEYIRCSLKGTLRRLGTKDGRSLGVDELPPTTTTYPSGRVLKEKPGTTFPGLVQAKTRTAPVEAIPSTEKVARTPVEAIPSTEKVARTPVERKNQKSKAKTPAKASEASMLATTVFVSDFEVAEVIEGQKQTREEEEKARKEEELRKEEEAARMKEQHRLEEKAKAEAALERKKRNAQRAQARAAAKVQKEAEMKEKEREKKLKKKKRKMTAGSTPADAETQGEHDPSSPSPTETTQEPETMEKVELAAKRPQRRNHFIKQTKAKSIIPPSLRNRGKKKMQPWMWVLLISVIVLALFLAGNGRELF